MMGLYDELLHEREELAKEIRAINDSDLTPQEKSAKKYWIDRRMEEVENNILVIEIYNENIPTM